MTLIVGTVTSAVVTLWRVRVDGLQRGLTLGAAVLAGCLMGLFVHPDLDQAEAHVSIAQRWAAVLLHQTLFAAAVLVIFVRYGFPSFFPR